MKEELKNVTRVEVIDGEGRAYLKYGVNDIELSVQDNGTTLKIFIRADEGATHQTWLASQKGEAT